MLELTTSTKGLVIEMIMVQEIVKELHNVRIGLFASSIAHAESATNEWAGENGLEIDSVGICAAPIPANVCIEKTSNTGLLLYYHSNMHIKINIDTLM